MPDLYGPSEAPVQIGEETPIISSSHHQDAPSFSHACTCRVVHIEIEIVKTVWQRTKTFSEMSSVICFTFQGAISHSDALISHFNLQATKVSETLGKELVCLEEVEEQADRR